MSITNLSPTLNPSTLQGQADREPVLKENDGVLVVANGRSEHPLQTEHCKPCVSIYDGLKAQAESGDAKSNELLKRAQVQMEALQSAQINTLSQKSKTPIAYARPLRESASSVTLSEDAKMRLANIARLQPKPDSSAAADDKLSPSKTSANVSRNTEIAPTKSESSQTSTDKGLPAEPTASSASLSPKAEHSAGDGHDHGESHGSATGTAKPDEISLSDAELEEVKELQLRDAEVRAHEQAHKSAAGSHGGSISLSYEQGPDGKRYAVEGEVPVDLSNVKDDPAATLAKMQQIQRAALAPAEPSSADRRVAARAAQKASSARKEIAELAKNEENPLKSQRKDRKDDDLDNASSKRNDGARAQGNHKSTEPSDEVRPREPESQNDITPHEIENSVLARKTAISAYSEGVSTTFSSPQRTSKHHFLG